MGPSAPAALAPLETPAAPDWPLSDSTKPMAASTDHGRPGQVAAACCSRVTQPGGTAGPAVAPEAAAPPAAVDPPFVPVSVVPPKATVASTGSPTTKASTSRATAMSAFRTTRPPSGRQCVSPTGSEGRTPAVAVRPGPRVDHDGVRRTRPGDAAEVVGTLVRPVVGTGTTGRWARA